MSNNNIIQRLSKLESQVTNIELQITQNNKLFKELTKVLTPVFPRDIDSHISSEEATQVISNERRRCVANSLNPDLHSVRDIDLVLPEAKADCIRNKTNATPTISVRVGAMLNLFRKEQKKTTTGLKDPMVQQDYKILRTFARRTLDELWNDLRKTYKETELPSWANVAKELKERYILLFEKRAVSAGFPIDRCKQFWAAKGLLADVYKHRHGGSKKDKSQNPTDESDQFANLFRSMQQPDFEFNSMNIFENTESLEESEEEDRESEEEEELLAPQPPLKRARKNK